MSLSRNRTAGRADRAASDASAGGVRAGHIKHSLHQIRVAWRPVPQPRSSTAVRRFDPKLDSSIDVAVAQSYVPFAPNPRRYERDGHSLSGSSRLGFTTCLSRCCRSEQSPIRATTYRLGGSMVRMDAVNWAAIVGRAWDSVLSASAETRSSRGDRDRSCLGGRQPVGGGPHLVGLLRSL
jgi:hypothetical protein